MTKRAETGELERARGERVVEEVADESWDLSERLVTLVWIEKKEEKAARGGLCVERTYSPVGFRPLAFSSGTGGGCGEGGGSGEGSGQVSLETELAETSRDLKGLRDI